MKPGEGRGGGDAPPPRAGPPLLASGLLVAVATLLLVVGARPPASGALRPPPFQTGHPELERAGPDAVLYVSSACPWCAVELDAWAATLEGSGLRGPRVVYGPASDPGAPDRLPPPLAGRAHADADGSVGRALGVAAVPFLARLDGAGTVVSVRTGLLSREERHALLRELNPRPSPQEDIP